MPLPSLDALTPTSILNHPPRLLFLHLRKTAGTSLLKILLKALNENQVWNIRGHVRDLETYTHQLIEAPTEEKLPFKLFHGHIAYGLESYIPDPVIPMTILREPKSLLVSQFFFWKFRHGEENRKLRGFDFDSMYTNPQFPHPHVYVDNPQVRFLAGEKGLPVDVPMGECTEAMLELAKHRLETQMAFGLTERFDDFLVYILSPLMNIQRPFYTRERVNGKKPKFADLPGSSQQLVQDHSQLDQALYQFAKTLFEERLNIIQKQWPQDESTSFEGKRGHFQRLNRWYGWYARLNPFLKEREFR